MPVVSDLAHKFHTLFPSRLHILAKRLLVRAEQRIPQRSSVALTGIPARCWHAFFFRWAYQYSLMTFLPGRFVRSMLPAEI